MMSPYQIDVTCSVCGEPGKAHVRDGGGEWLGGTFKHINGHVCAENLKRRLEKLEKTTNAETK
jgi:hypothetical protein